MGRPLNKKYFGNRNIGSTGTGDNYGIGGEGIASINFSTLGSFAGNSNVAVLTVPAFPAPTLPSGVQATYSATYEVESVVTGAGKTDLAVGDTFADDETFPGMIAKVTDVSGANAVFSVTTTGASRGDAYTLATIPQDTIGVTLTQTGGDGTAGTFLVDVYFRVKAVTIVEKGSGYVGTETWTITKPGTTSGTVPAGTIVLTTDSGSAGSTTNQENAVTPYAWVNTKTNGDLNSTANSGSSVVGDIVKQVNDRVFKVKTAQGTGRCILVAAAPAEPTVLGALGQMTITATDQAGCTYYVYRITSRTAVLVPYGGGSYQFPVNSDGTYKKVKWTFGAAVAPSGSEAGVVTIANK